MSPKLAVVQGAILKCDKGTTPSLLTVTTPSFSYVEGSLVATIMDHLPGGNIKPFGVCGILQGPCVPATPLPWVPGEIGIPLVPSLFPILSNVSLLPCVVGGLIQIISSGQSTVFVDSLHSSAEARTDSDFPSLGDLLSQLVWDSLAGGAEGYAAWKEKVLRGRAQKFRKNARRALGNPPKGKQQKERRHKQRKRNSRTARGIEKNAGKVNKLKWASRLGGPLLSVGQAGLQVAKGHRGDAAATVVGGVAGSGAALGCGAVAGLLGIPSAGTSAVAGGLVCGGFGAVVGGGASWATKKLGKLLG